MRPPSRISSALSIALASAGLGTPVRAQSVAVEARVGAFLPTSDLGTVGVTRARLSPATAVSAAVTLTPTAMRPFRVILTGTTSIGPGTQIRPTSSCLIRCTPYTADHGSFRTGSADVAVAIPLGGLDVRLALGPAVRQYNYAESVCACDPLPPGESFEAPFFISQSAAAVHAGVGLSGPAAGHFAWIFHIDAIFSGSRWGKAQRDLLVAVGLSF